MEAIFDWLKDQCIIILAYVLLQVLCLECVCFKEIISVSFLHSSVRKYVRPEATLVEEKEIPLFKSMNWYASCR